MRLLLLGGTSEASRLAGALAERSDVEAILSLAGRTAAPAPAPIPLRIGGFGGAEGLAAYLKDSRTDAVVDATHPFAARISANAVAACRLAELPLLAFSRLPWAAAPGDQWIHAPDIDAAASQLAGMPPRSVFLTTGRLDLAAFGAAPQHRYLVRTIDPPARAAIPLHAVMVRERGPFDVASERALMRQHGTDLIVTKNSGGTAARAKLDAARQLGLPVLMVARPPVPARPECHALDEVLAWIDSHVLPSR